MPTSYTWPGGATGATATSYSIPAAGELNWSTLSAFLAALAQGAQATTFQKFAVRKATSSPVTVAVTDCVIETKLSVAGAVTVNLPAGADKQVFYICDGTGDAATNNITIARNGSDTINGATSYVISNNYGSVMLVYNASDTDWKVASRNRPIATLTASRALASDSAGNVAVSTVTTTQLQYLAGATGTTGTGNVVLSASPSFTGEVSLTGGTGMRFGNAQPYGTTATMNDDTATSFTPSSSPNGTLYIYSRSPSHSAAVYGIYAFQTTSSMFVQAISNVGTAMATSTSVLAGTTGTDTKFTVSAANDGKIYLENRLGSAIAVHFMLIGV